MKNNGLSYFEKLLITISLIFCVTIFAYNFIDEQPVQVIHMDNDGINNFDEGYIIYENSLNSSSDSHNVNSSMETISNKININTADSEELTKLKGVGQVLAQRIIDYRNNIGKFSNIEQLKDIDGISNTKFETIKDYITL